MRVGLDIDGVLADFNTAFIEKVIEVTGEDKFPPRPFDVPTWDYPQHYGYTNEQISKVWEALKASETFWEGLQVYSGVIPHVWDLDTLENTLYYITNRFGVDVEQQTIAWLGDSLGMFSPTVFVSPDKGHYAKELELDYYIDDRAENIEDVERQSPTTVAVLRRRPWNTHREHGHIVNDFREFVDLVTRR